MPAQTRVIHYYVCLGAAGGKECKVKMNIKKNCGIVLIVLGIILTLDRTNEFKGIVSIIVYYIQEYWPLFITFCGVSLLATPQKTKKK